ncbi:hypothetical protein QO003_003711 [Arthrobacter silviterrae]|uniref:Suppressor of fused domain protein n=1 Tax=Arthrobacter silviterrae TaxID=2026658 RepID=A0ABX0DD54_9MICC|nr:hypothetical protein [Arthrobacter silviterrae]MDQ0279408.1 hypothetical protein [Arthrobacter silviterrae]NGN82112.1 hypothetical protein [Arthrobacter silviterrae]
MSYDLSVYAAGPLSFDDLVRLVRGTIGLDVDGSPSSDAQSLMVVRGARRAYCFTIDGPFGVEAEDVPEDVTASVIGAKAVYQVLVEGSEEASIPHAVKFARKLAKATGGALLDEQTDEVWPRAKGSRVARPREAARPTELVTVNFYTLMSELPEDLPGNYIALARKYLPEALPTRFGTYEPHQGKLDRDGDQAFTDMWSENPRSRLFFKCDYPIAWGAIPGPEYPSSVWHASLYLDGAALADPGWLDGLRRFFVAFALESNSFFASVEVLRNYEWVSRSYERLPGAEEEIWPIHVGEWKGFVPYPQSWTWFGPEQAGIVSPYLTGRREQHGEYLFHVLAEKPVDRDQLTALLPDPTRPWIPKELATPCTR